MTKIGMQEKLVRIWHGEQITMVLVTHDLEEAIFLADRILMLPKKGGVGRKVLDISLPRPRDRSEAHFVAMRQRLMSEFGLH